MKFAHLNGHPITFCHYPMLEWKSSRKEGSAAGGQAAGDFFPGRAAAGGHEPAACFRRQPRRQNRHVAGSRRQETGAKRKAQTGHCLTHRSKNRSICTPPKANSADSS